MIRADCLLVVHQRSGMMFTIHNTRLFPAEAADAGPLQPAARSMSAVRAGQRGRRGPGDLPLSRRAPCDLVEPTLGLERELVVGYALA